MTTQELRLQELPKGTKVKISTLCGEYELEVVNPSTGEVLFCGGKYFEKPIRCYFKSTYGANPLLDRPGLIRIGLLPVLTVPGAGTQHKEDANFRLGAIVSFKVIELSLNAEAGAGEGVGHDEI